MELNETDRMYESGSDTDSDSSIDIDTLATESLSFINNELKNNQHIKEEECDKDSVIDGLNFVIDKRPNITKLDASREKGNQLISEKEDQNNLNKKRKRKRKKKNKAHPKKTSSELSSSLQDGLSCDLYINTDLLVQKKIPQKDTPTCRLLYNKDTLLKKSVLPTGMEKEHSLPPYEVSLNQTRKQRKLERSQTKGPLWFNMKAPEMTEEKKNDLAVLQMRHVLDPKRFYKQMDIRGTPKFFQMGKIVEDSTDFYSGRVPKKQRKRTLVDELLEDAEFKKYNKRKYAEIVEKTQRNKGAYKHMKRLKKKKK